MKLIIMIMTLILFYPIVSIEKESNKVSVKEYNDCVDEGNKCAKLLVRCNDTAIECKDEIKKSNKPDIKRNLISGFVGVLLGIIFGLLL